jgi:hypothetical protein
MIQDLFIAGAILAGTFTAGYYSAALTVWLYNKKEANKR